MVTLRYFRERGVLVALSETGSADREFAATQLQRLDALAPDDRSPE